ncbi:MAG: tyrosine-type recombinase/integrase [Acidimicrobiales bacterium]
MNGSMRELAPSKRSGERRWELRVYVGRDPDKTVRDPETGRIVKQGPPVHLSRVFKGGKRGAARELAKMATEAHQGRRVGPTATVGKLLTEWMANLERQGKARSTLETYAAHVDKHIRPGLGSIRLDKLGTHDVDRYLGSLAEKGLAPRTIRTDHAVLSAALTQGVAWGWLPANPAKAAKLASDHSEAASITVDQLRQLYAAALVDDPDMAIVIALGALTGCRRGELAGLRWEDLDRERATLRVERAWVPGKGGQHLNAFTKTKKARTVHIGAAGVALLDGYRQVLRERMAGAEPAGWLLSYNGGETPMRAKSMTEYMASLAKRLGITAHFHTMRHFAASELVGAGVDLAVAARQLGHSPQVMAATYRHADDGRGAAAGELIAGVVGRALDTAPPQMASQPPGISCSVGRREWGVGL